MTQREKAIECLQQLDTCFVYQFIQDDEVYVFDGYIGEPVYKYPDVQEKIAEVENGYGCLVYAVTHELLDFGECYSMLAVSKYEEDWPHCLSRIEWFVYSAFAYVWNKTDETCSEFGSVAIECDFGGILRVG